MRTFEFKILIVDDDVEMLQRMTRMLRGLHVELGSRRVVPKIYGLPVVVQHDDDTGYTFTEDTLKGLTDLAARRYDYILLDYAFTEKSVQAVRWIGTGKAESNHASLTVSDLREAVEHYNLTSLRGEKTKQLKRFFLQRAWILLRSFQHDRVSDKLGTYEHRKQTTRGVFTSPLDIHALDGFQLIYGADSELRDTLYHGVDRGRDLYRNVVLALTSLYVRSAMNEYLAHRAGRLVVARRAWTVTVLTAAITALSIPTQLIWNEAVTRLATNPLAAIGLFGIGVVFIAVGAIGTTFVIERVLWRYVEKADRND